MLTPWKKSYDQPRQHTKKQRHDFANKGITKYMLHRYVYPIKIHKRHLEAPKNRGINRYNLIGVAQ